MSASATQGGHGGHNQNCVIALLLLMPMLKKCKSTLFPKTSTLLFFNDSVNAIFYCATLC